MLYDKRWDKTEAKPDVFSLEGLIAWLEKQSPANSYCFFNNGGCLLHQYFTASAVDIDWVGGYTYTLKGQPSEPLPEPFEDISADYPHTFGAALERARAALLRLPQVPEAVRHD